MQRIAVGREICENSWYPLVRLIRNISPFGLAQRPRIQGRSTRRTNVQLATNNRYGVGRYGAMGKLAGFVFKFHPAGELKSVGFKFDRWLDSLWMQRGVG